MKLFAKILCAAVCLPMLSFAQLGTKKETYTRADTLRGALTPLRTCYDINYYHLDVKFDIEQKFISGNVLFKFTATQDFTKLQFDLYENLKVEKVIYKGKSLPFTREANAVFVTFDKPIKSGTKDAFTVHYSGNPTVAKRAPWDGGVVYTTDSLKRPWVATACQGAGASIWWPTKDHQSDEVDSMLISISVPKGLKNISNGRLRKTTQLKDGYTKFDWFVSYPINNYDVAANIAHYEHIADTYKGEDGKLTLDYWVLSYNVDKAKKHFGEDVKPMMKTFEHWFGPYPFYRDGYKLVETPHLGMEHQSAVAYGNKYKKGYLGGDMSGTGYGLKWDYIIIHETGHEWFGNNVTTKDIADMWVHEGFTTYSEAIFVEGQWGKEAGQQYVHGLRRGISNDGPIIGPYNVNKEGSGDMYPKGAVLLNMVRTIINNDEKWREILRGIQSTFGKKTTTSQEVTAYISEKAGINLAPVFTQYLKYSQLPILEFTSVKGRLLARWIAAERNFKMPVRVRVKGGDYTYITPTTNFAPVNIDGITKENVEVDTFNYYIGVLN